MKQLMIVMLLMTILTFISVYVTAILDNLWIWGIWFMVIVLFVVRVFFGKRTRSE